MLSLDNILLDGRVFSLQFLVACLPGLKVFVLVLDDGVKPINLISCFIQKHLVFLLLLLIFVEA